jgi:deoxyadenosine/deoxycytidine kinase
MNVSIEGNIGCGKTSLIRALKLNEPLSQTSIIDPKDNVQYLTSCVDFPWCVDKIIHFSRPNTENLVVWENNPYSLLKVFGHIFTKPLLKPMQYSLFKAIVRRVFWKPTVMFYIDLDIDTIIKRNGRLHNCREILINVEQQYDYVLRHVQDVHVIHLDGTLPTAINANIINNFINKLKIIN